MFLKAAVPPEPSSASLAGVLLHVHVYSVDVGPEVGHTRVGLLTDPTLVAGRAHRITNREIVRPGD